MDVSAIVLAGGRSTRFGRDKLAEPLDGATVLERTIAAVMTVASDVIVVVRPDSGPALSAGVRLARDPMPDGGPLVGVLAGLAAASHRSVLIVGGDMPWLVPGVLRSLLLALGPDKEAAALDSDGHPQQLPIAVRRDAAAAVARRLTGSGERRLGALLDALELVVIAERDWRLHDDEGATLRDIDTPGDLPNLPSG